MGKETYKKDKRVKHLAKDKVKKTGKTTGILLEKIFPKIETCCKIIVTFD